MLIRVLGDTSTVGALRLAGIEGRTVDPSDDCARAFDEMLRQEDLGVLLVTEPVAQQIRSRVEQAKLGRRLPLVLEIPARGAPSAPADDLVARVARMIGLRA
jgi:V/A-type H+-transporting ATPase subunit F